MSIEFKSLRQTTETSEAKSVSVDCYRNLNLLAHAQIEELDLGSRCGGYGECGGDRVRVSRGAEFLSAITEAEREHLDSSELEQGYRLACQCFPERDGVEIQLEVLT
jgi:ferredoxin